MNDEVRARVEVKVWVYVGGRIEAGVGKTVSVPVRVSLRSKRAGVRSTSMVCKYTFKCAKLAQWTES